MYPALEREKHPEVLRMLCQSLIKENESLRKILIEVQAKKLEEAQLKINLQDKLLVFKKLIFGRSSEKRNVEQRQNDQEQAELLIDSQQVLPPLKDKNVKELEEEIIDYFIGEDECLIASKELGLESPSIDQWQDEDAKFYDESKEVSIIERKYVKKIHRRHKRKLKPEFNNTGKEVIITASGPLKLVIGSNYSIDFAVSVASDKYVSHMPLARQTKQMNSLGLKNMGTKTLYNLCQGVAVHLEEITTRIKKEIFSARYVLHCDETPWPIQIKEQDDGYMWTMSNRLGSYYIFEPTRSGSVIEAELEGFTGVILSDGYAGYNRLKKKQIQVAHCWAHARRKFFEIRENYPECDEILDLIDKLFEYERETTTYESRKQLREDKSREKISEIKEWLNLHHQDARAESGLRKAIEYCVKLWEGLTAFLENELIPLSNNEAERTIRHAVMGRKNFYGSRTHNGADVAAIMYTIIESCKKVELDPRTFILMAVTESAKGNIPPTPLDFAKSIRSQ